MNEAMLRLTQFSPAQESGRLSPEHRRSLLGSAPSGIVLPQLLSGLTEGEPVAVYQLNRTQALVAAADFVSPMVDDPTSFGRIAAANALSAIYSAGGNPLLALALVGMPVNALPTQAIAAILAGGQASCAEAGIPIAGGHTIDAVQPVYGLAVLGIVHPEHLKLTRSGRAGDRLILAKPLGMGLYAAAERAGRLSGTERDALIDSAQRLNTPGPLLACLDGVHAMTEVGDGGLLGSLHALCERSALAARIRLADLPQLPHLRSLFDAGFSAGLAGLNWQAFAPKIGDAGSLDPYARALLADPQISGGLLVSCTADTVTEVLSICLQQGFAQVSVIGELAVGEPAIHCA